MKAILTISVLVALLGFTHCNQPANSYNAVLGRYKLLGHDDAGRLIFTGTISVTSVEQSDLKGHCKVVKAIEAFEGAVDKDGACEGTGTGNKVTLDLAPQLADGGLIFEGQFDNGRITGIWMFETFAGRKPQGKFEATKIE